MLMVTLSTGADVGLDGNGVLTDHRLASKIAVNYYAY